MIKKFTIEIDEEKKEIKKDYGAFSKIELLGILELERHNLLFSLSKEQEIKKLKGLYNEPEIRKAIIGISKEMSDEEIAKMKKKKEAQVDEPESDKESS